VQMQVASFAIQRAAYGYKQGLRHTCELNSSLQGTEVFASYVLVLRIHPADGSPVELSLSSSSLADLCSLQALKHHLFRFFRLDPQFSSLPAASIIQHGDASRRSSLQ
jgi:hypothetical protein